MIIFFAIFCWPFEHFFWPAKPFGLRVGLVALLCGLCVSLVAFGLCRGLQAPLGFFAGPLLVFSSPSRAIFGLGGVQGPFGAFLFV